jgi:hypothetical protein
VGSSTSHNRPARPDTGIVFLLILPATLGLGVYSASNRNEYQQQKNNVYEE